MADATGESLPRAVEAAPRPPPPGSPRRRRAAIPLFAILAGIAWLGVAGWYEQARLASETRRQADEARSLGRDRAALVEAALVQNLGRLDGVAVTVAVLPQVQQAAARGGSPDPAIEDVLHTAALQLGADLVLVADASGKVIDSSAGRGPQSGLGADIADREYFLAARATGHGRQFAVGRKTGIPGLYFASAIRDASGEFRGVVTAKRDTVNLAALVGQEGAFVTDASGVVVMGEDRELLMHALPGAPVLRMTPAARRDRYGRDDIPVADLGPWDPAHVDGLTRLDGRPEPLALVERATPTGEFVVHVAQPLADVPRLVRRRFADFSLLSLAGLGAIGLISAGWNILRSRRRGIEMLRELGESNRRLSAEVAQREHAQAELHASREVLETQGARLRALLRSVPELVWMKDRGGAYLAVNAAYERFHGQPAGEVLGKTDVELHGADVAERYRREDEAAMAAEEPLRTAEWDESSDGRRIWLEIARTAARDEHGRVVGVVAVARDTTEIHQAQVALKASEARFRATFETAGDAILIVREGIVVDCNARALQLFGTNQRLELLGMALKDLSAEAQRQPGENTDTVQERVAEAKVGSRRPFEWRCTRLTGEEFDAEITFSVFKHNGIRLLQAVIRDVSERRRMTAAIEAARDEAERANRSKSVFLANMSHEIRTPLNAVLGFTQLLLGDHRLPAETLQRLGVIHAAGQRLLGLINDVLDLAKIESGSLQVIVAPFDLAQELGDIAQLFEASARSRGLALECDLALGDVAVVEGDRTKVGQIVQNLLGNAVKFTEQGRVRLVARRSAEQVTLVVEDTGVGIAPEDMSRMFVPFRQGAAGHEKGGTGLGLVLSRDMARAMGGELTLRSTPGVGTRVEVTLPLPASDVRLDEDWYVDGRQRLDEGTTCRVLVVEDDADSREVLAQVLRTAGCEVVEAADGAEGLAACAPGRFEIVFTDIRMPNLDGIRMIEQVRAIAGLETLPVVAVSASSLEHERRFYLERGFQDFIGKPYPFHEVYRMLAQHAGARLHRIELVAEATPDGTSVPTTPGASGGRVVVGSATHRRLLDLVEAASGGEMVRVRRLLNELGQEALGATRWRQLDEAAQSYDFQALEARVRALLDDASA